MTTTHDQLRSAYATCKAWLRAESPDDEAAQRSLDRKYEQLKEARFFGEISYEAALEELFQECYDCLPVDA